MEHAATIVSIYRQGVQCILCILANHNNILQSSLSVQLEYKLPSLLSQQSVKLIIIDSLAALFRVEFTAGQAAQRAQLLRAFGAQLRRLSDEYGAAVICVNQVSPHVYSILYSHFMALSRACLYKYVVLDRVWF